jgi:hypothetical protein
MKEVFLEMKNVDIGRYLVKGPLGDLDPERWTPPQCLYLPELNLTEIKKLDFLQDSRR